MSFRDQEFAPTPGTKLCRLEDVPIGRGKEIVLGESSGRWPFRMFVVRSEASVWGYANACPHLHIPLDLSPDRFVSADGAFIQCANHGALFQLDDGYCVSGPCGGESLTQIPVVVKDGAIVTK